ncbi:hypothetical protein NKH77_40380 [Streptomyces sp. M19]
MGTSAPKARRLPAQASVIAPLRVHFVVDVDGDAAALHGRISKRERWQFSRNQRSAGWSWTRERDPELFDFFYDRMYRPTMRASHGDRERLEGRSPRTSACSGPAACSSCTTAPSGSAGAVPLGPGDEGDDAAAVRRAGRRPEPLRQRRLPGDLPLPDRVVGRERRAPAGLRRYGAVPQQGHVPVEAPLRHPDRAAAQPLRHQAAVAPGAPRLPAVRDFLVANPLLAEGRDGALEAVYFQDGDRPAREDFSVKSPDRYRVRHVDLDAFLKSVPGGR